MNAPSLRWVGTRVPRVEDARFVSGQARYVADVELPGALHVVFVRSPEAHARIETIDARQTHEVEGHVGCFTGRDVIAKPLVDALPLDGLLRTPQPPLAVDRVRFVGEAVAAVVASSRAAAEDAAELVRVDYEPAPLISDAESALAPGAHLLFEELGTNLVYHRIGSAGAVDAAFARADHVFAKTFRSNRVAAAPLEPRGCAAAFEQHSSQLTVWSSTQTPHLLRTTLADSLGIPEHRVRVIAPDVGGGFGQKMSTHPEELVVAFLAVRLGRPVRWIEDRVENLLAATHAKEQVVSLSVAVTAEGELVGLRARCVGDAGAYSFNSSTAVVEPLMAALLMPSVYRLENYFFEVLAVLTNKSPVGSYRGVGWTAGHTARELLLDEVARGLNIDPVELRRINMIPATSFPFTSCTGMVYDSGSYVESLDRAVDMVGYSDFRSTQRALQDEGRYVGVGVSPFVEPTGYGTEIGVQTGFPYPSNDSASVSVDPSGTVTVNIGLHSHGQGHETSLAQIAADALGTSPSNVVVKYGDTDIAPYGMGTFGSRGAVIGAGAISRAASDVRRQVLEVASRLLEVNALDLSIFDGVVSVRGAPDRGLSLGEVAWAAHFPPDARTNRATELYARRSYDPPATYSNGCIAALVEVDVETGRVEVLNLAAVEDCGVVINPMIVEGQIHGALAQAVGLTLFEQLVYEEGQLLTTSFANYLLPGAKEVPRIDVLHIETPSPVTETGIKGMGEGGVLAGPAAIANAVADALAPFSASISELPLTPERVAALVNIGTPLPHRREIDSYRGSTEEVSGSNPTTS